MLQDHIPDPRRSSNADDHPVFSSAQGNRRRRCNAWFIGRIAMAAAEGPFTEIIQLDPVMAELFLEVNASNRAMKPLAVERFKTDIRNGQWTLNGESLKISVDGLLNDGQHRCAAVVASGNSIQTMITFGVERESRLTLDQGTARTPGDYIGMQGVPSANQVAAVVSLVFQYSETGQVSHQTRYRPTKAQVLECWLQHPNVLESVRAIPSKGSGVVGGVSVLAFSHYVLSLKDKDAASFFLAKLVAGDELAATEPVYLLRQRLIGDKRLKPSEKVELIFRAWNAHRRGRRPTKLQLMGTLPALER